MAEDEKQELTPLERIGRLQKAYTDTVAAMNEFRHQADYLFPALRDAIKDRDSAIRELDNRVTLLEHRVRVRDRELVRVSEEWRREREEAVKCLAEPARPSVDRLTKVVEILTRPRS